MSDMEHKTEDSNENFEEMLERSLQRSDGNDVGETVTGKIISLTTDSAFVDISGKTDAMINITEFMDDDGTVTVKAGDTITGFIASTRSGEIHITSKIGLGFFSQELLDVAHKNRLPVYGRVSEKTKGGYGVTIAGSRCFCPLSQIDLKVSQSHDDYLDRTLTFMVIEYSSRGKKIILSRRALMEEQRDRCEEELKKTLSVGDRIKGTVNSIQNFGLFIDIGGMQALLPKSEISWSRDTSPSSFTVGSEIEVAVKSIDWNERKISVSVKDLSPDPWSTVDRFHNGQEVAGKVVNIIKTGVFVEIAPGLEGFIHISNLNPLKKVNKPEDVVSRNDAVNVRILAIKKGDKKMSLELVTDGQDPWLSDSNALMDTIHEATIESINPSGVSARLSNGMLGFIPKEELRMKKGGDIQQEYPAGNAVKVTIKRMDQNEKRMILSEEGAVRRAEKQEYERFIKKESAAGTSTLGSMFGDKFDKIKKDING